MTRNAALSRAGSGRGKPLDQLWNIESLIDRLVDIFNRGIFIKTDETFASRYWSDHECSALCRPRQSIKFAFRITDICNGAGPTIKGRPEPGKSS